MNPEELDLDTAAMQAKYDQTLREQQSHIEKDDLAEMVADHAARQQKVGVLVTMLWMWLISGSPCVSVLWMWLISGSVCVFLWYESGLLQI